jgi:hypothetical protein
LYRLSTGGAACREFLLQADEEIGRPVPACQTLNKADAKSEQLRNTSETFCAYIQVD